jgi:LysR family transcriptional regulator, transcriptional activator of nhaA
MNERVKMPLNYHHLNYFRVIASEGSIAAAAKALRVSQSSLSIQLKQLENFIDNPLFVRERKRLVLTEMGRTVLVYADEIHRLGSELLELTRKRVDPMIDHLHIGALDGVPKSVVTSLIEEAYRNDRCMVTLTEGTREDIYRGLSEHRVDVVLAHCPPPMDPKHRIHARKIGKSPIVACSVDKFKNLQPGFPHSLDGQPLILPTRHSMLRHQVDHFFKLNQLSLNCVLETEDASIRKRMAMSGLGVLILSDIAAENFLDGDQTVNFGQMDDLWEEYWLISATKKVEHPIVEKLMRGFQITTIDSQG